MAFRKMARTELVITPDTRLDDLWNCRTSRVPRGIC